MNYRREIDGLRAVAMLPVIFFHAGFGLFSGGFVGVDVFFVISGYLITSILLGEQQTGKFSIVGFYERRARRILPALFLVMLASLPFAWIWMLPDYFENFGQSLVATVFFGNNVLLWLTSGYFALESEFKPMIHTWSLGVEEQYYVFFPLLVMALWSRTKHHLTVVIALLAAASFIWAEYAILKAPDAAFYLLPSRAWELLLGSLSAIYLARDSEDAGRIGRPLLEQCLGLLGLALILLAVFGFDKHTPFPGRYALVPTLGTVLIVLFAKEHTIAAKILGHRILVFTGLISYSAYLWHQPLFAFARLRSLTEPGPAVFAGLSVLTFVLAYLTWRFVENPFRNRQRLGRAAIFWSTGLTGLLIAAICGFIYINSGFVHLRAELNSSIKSAGRRLNAAFNERPYAYRHRPFQEDGKRHILVVGNSYARDFINAGMENHYFTGSEISYSDEPLYCKKTPESISPILRQNLGKTDYLVFVSSAIAPACWQSDFELFKQLGAKHIVVVGTKNFGWNMNAVMLLDPAIRYSYRSTVLPYYTNENQQMLKTLPPSYYVDLLAMISDTQGQVPVFTEDRKLISQDSFHLTKDGAKYIGKRLFESPLLAPLK